MNSIVGGSGNFQVNIPGLCIMGVKTLRLPCATLAYKKDNHVQLFFVCSEDVIDFH